MTSKTGTVNNVMQVKRTDFEVFDALTLDSQDSDMSGAGTHIKSLRATFEYNCFSSGLYSSLKFAKMWTLRDYVHFILVIWFCIKTDLSQTCPVPLPAPTSRTRM